MKKMRNLKFLALFMALFLAWTTCYMPGTKAAESTDRYKEGYGISDILSQFQYFVQNSEMTGGCHTVGGIVVGDTMNSDNTFGDAAISPSYIGNLVKGQFGNAWHGKYPEKADIVYYGESSVSGLDPNTWIQNKEYMDVDAAFELIKDESSRLATLSTPISEGGDNVVTIDCTAGGDVYVVFDYDTFSSASRINIVVDDVDWFKKHICSISITGGEGEDFTFDGDYKIAINGEKIGNQLKNMSGGDDEYGAQLNVEGMNLVWNFPDATGTITAQGLGGHMVAPNATVDFVSGNYEGGVIAAKITGSAQGHFYPMSATLQTQDPGDDPDDPVTATGTFSKKAVTGSDELDGAKLTLSYTGEFNPAEEAEWVSGPQITLNKNTKTISWTSSKTAGQLVLSNLPSGIYTLAETGAPNGYKYASSIVFKVENGNIYMGTKDSAGKTTFSTTPLKAGDVIEMIDEPVTGSFSKKAVGTTAELDGAELSLKYTGSGSLKNVNRKSGPAITATDTEITWTSSKTAGELILEKLPNGTYEMTETTAPQGYKIAETIYFKVEAGKIYKGTKSGNTITYEKDPMTTTGFVMYDAAKTGKTTIEGNKKVTVNSGTLSEETFTFVLKKGNEVIDTQSVTASAAGTFDFSFKDLTYGLADIGKTYTYTVSEVIPTQETIGMEYDETIYTVTVKITDDPSSDDLTVNVTIDKNGSIEFTNEYTEPTPAAGRFSKTSVAGGPELPGASLSLTCTSDPEVDLEETVEKLAGPDINVEGNKITWESGNRALILDGLPNGEYVMTETGAPKGYAYAEEIYFQIKDGQIYVGEKDPETGEITYSDDPNNRLEMIDTAKGGSLTLTGNKTVTGNPPKTETYTFTVTDKATGDVVATGTAKGSGPITFTEIEYGPEDVDKTYTYVVAEDVPSPKTEGMTYDTTKFTVTVKVEDKGQGYDNLTVTAEYDANIEFVNVYKKPQTSTTETPTTETPTTQTPTTETPTTQTPTTETPTTQTPTTETPSTEPSEDDPTTEAEKGGLIIIVTDEETGDRVPNATVTVTDPSGNSVDYVTDENGTITIDNLDPGTYSVTVIEVPEGYKVTTGESAQVLVEAGKTSIHEAMIIPSSDSETKTPSGDSSSSQTKTGDAFNIIIPVAMILVSLVGIVVIAIRRKKH